MNPLVAILSILTSSALFVILALLYLKLDISFLFFKFKKHPLIMKLLDDVLNRICAEEDIAVFYKTTDEINKNNPNKDDWAIGKYIYSSDMEFYSAKMKEFAEAVNKIEEYYHMSYEEYCKKFNEVFRPIEEYHLPKILIGDDLKSYDMGGHYHTFFHELGHHFAVKEMGTNHNEEDANRYAHELIVKELPFFFQLFYDFNEGLGKKELKFFQKIGAYFQYLYYLAKEKIYIYHETKTETNF